MVNLILGDRDHSVMYGFEAGSSRGRKSHWVAAAGLEMSRDEVRSYGGGRGGGREVNGSEIWPDESCSSE